MARSRTLIGGVVLTLAVLVLAPLPAALAAPPAFSKVFTPDTIGPGSETTLTFTIDNSAETAPADELAFSDTLPAGVVIATPANASTTCDPDAGGDGPDLTAPAGGTTIMLANAGVGAGKVCTVRVDVTSTTTGTHTNTSGPLSSSAGTGGTATDDLTVDTDLPGFAKDFSPDPIDKGERTKLTFTIDNTANASAVDNLDFVDTLPTGMVIADPANASTDCVGTVGTTLTAEPGTSVIVLDAAGTAGFPALAADATCTVSVDVVATAGGTLLNESGGLQADFVEAGKATATLVATVSDLHITKAFPDDPIPPGGTATLRLTIENFDRDFPATGVAFTDNLPAGVTVAAAPPATNGCGGTLTAAGSTISLSGGTVPAEGSCVITVPVTAAATGSYTNTTGAVSGTVDGEGLTGNQATETLYVVAAPSLTKEFTDDPVAAGGMATIKFTITDTTTAGGSTDITFTDELTAATDTFGNPTGGFLPFPVSIDSPTLPASVCGGTDNLELVSLGTNRQGLELTGGTLASGAQCDFSVVVDIPAGLATGDYRNTTGRISATVGGMPVTGAKASDVITIVGGPQLGKEFTTDPIKPGASVTLEFTLTNDSPTMPPATTDFTATGIGFTDNLAAVAAGLTLGSVVSNDCGGTVTGVGTTTITFSGGTLAPDSTCKIVVTVDSTTSTPQGKHGNTTSTVTATVAGVTTTSPAASDDLIVALLSIAKSFTDDPVFPGGQVTLQFTITNDATDASGNATSITFSDDLGDTLTVGVPGNPKLLPAAGQVPQSNVCGSGSTLSLTGDTLTLTGGNLTFGQSCTITVLLDVPSQASAGTYPNTTVNFRASFGGPLVPLANAGDDLVVDERVITIAKSFIDDPVQPGGTVTLRITIGNDTLSAAATDLAFTDNVGAALSGLAATGTPISNACIPVAPGGGPGPGPGTGTLSGTTTLTFTGGSLAAGDACVIDVTLSVPAGAGAGSYSNTTSTITGTVAAQPVVGNAATDVLKVVVPPPTEADLSITKTDAPDPVIAGQTLTYTVTVSNAGPSDAAAVKVTDTLPAGVTLVSTSGCAEDPGGVPTCTLGIVQKNTSKQYTITVTVNPSTTGALNNTATVSSSTPDPNGANNSASQATTVNTSADLAITKADSPDPVRLGQTLTYTVTVTNAGPSDATGVTVTDTPPAGVVQVRTTGCAEDPNGVPTCTLGTIAAGASKSYTITMRVTGNTARTLVNTATVAAGTTDPNSSNDTASAITTVSRPQQPEVGLFDPVTARWTQLLRSGTTRTFTFGNPGDYGIVGDWDGDGDRTVAVFRTLNGDTQLFARNSNSSGGADFTFRVGQPGDIPVAGDWNGDGRQTIALFRPSTATWFVFFDLADVVPDAVFTFGNPGDAPSAVDIDGDGDSDPVAYRDMGALGGRVFVRRSLSAGVADVVFTYGNPGDKVLFGDWDYDGDATVGVYRPGDASFYLRNSNSAGLADLTIPLGLGRELPHAGPL